MQPFLFVFPVFVSVFIVKVLPRILMAPLAVLLLVFLDYWIERQAPPATTETPAFSSPMRLPAEAPTIT